jgi:hypothetical protein
VLQVAFESDLATTYLSDVVQASTQTHITDAQPPKPAIPRIAHLTTTIDTNLNALWPH